MFRQLSAIALMLIYTLVSVGVMVHQHTCCLGLTALEVNGLEVFDDNCCHDKALSCDESGCCSDSAVYIALEDEHQWNNVSFNLGLLSRSEVNFNFLEAAELLVDLNYNQQESPRGPPLYLLHGSLVFYG